MLKLPSLTDCLLSLDNNVVTLTFNREDVRNALTGTAIADDIVKVVDFVNKQPEVAAMVITGAGSAFSSGGNVKDMADKAGDFAGDVAELEHKYRQGIQRIPLALDKLEVPLIAAVNGPAIGAGFDVANMCDIRIASDKAKFGETFANLGIIPGDGGAWYLQRIVGYQRACELTFSGRIVDAIEAKSLGLVLEVVSPDMLVKRANTLAQSIAAKPVAAMRRTKRLMKLAQRTELKDFLDICAVFQGVCHQDDDHLTAVEALLAKMAAK